MLHRDEFGCSPLSKFCSIFKFKLVGYLNFRSKNKFTFSPGNEFQFADEIIDSIRNKSEFKLVEIVVFVFIYIGMNKI